MGNYTKTIAQYGGDNVDYLIKIASKESSNNASAKNNTSSATGLFQITDSTWNNTVKQMGKAYTLEDRTDPIKATEVTAYLTEQNKKALESSLGRKATDDDLYLAHFFGYPQAVNFIKKAEEHPNEIGSIAFPRESVWNKNIFFEGNKPRTIAEVRSKLSISKVDYNPKQISLPNIPKVELPAIPLISQPTVATIDQQYTFNRPVDNTTTPAIIPSITTTTALTKPHVSTVPNTPTAQRTPTITTEVETLEDRKNTPTNPKADKANTSIQKKQLIKALFSILETTDVKLPPDLR